MYEPRSPCTVGEIPGYHIEMSVLFHYIFILMSQAPGWPVLNVKTFGFAVTTNNSTRIFNGCVLQIENSVTRVTVLASGCRTVMPSDGIFNSHRTTVIDYFSCILFRRRLDMRYFINLSLI